MEKVTKQEYINAKESVEMTPEVIDIIERAGKYGIIVEEVEEKPVEEIIVDDQEAGIIENLLEPVDVPHDELKQSREENERLRLENIRYQNESLERDKLAEKYNSSTEFSDASSVLDTVNSIKPEDFESGYDLMKAQLKAITEVLPKIAEGNSNDPNMRKVLDMVEDIERNKQIEEDKRSETENNRILEDEVNSFWGTHGDHKTENDYNESYNEYIGFAQKIVGEMGYDTNQLQLFLNKLAQPSTRGKLVSTLESKNITIPGCFENMQKTLAVLDYKNGVKINPTTGAAEAITDKFGNRQVLPDMDLAYHAMNRGNILATTKQQALLEVSQRSHQIDKGANTFSASRLDTISPDDVMGSQEMARILADVRENPKKYQTDPDAMARYNMVLTKLNR